jgi:hypothetical protein
MRRLTTLAALVVLPVGAAAADHAPFTIWALNEGKRQGYAVDEKALAELTAWAAARDISAKTPPRRGQIDVNEAPLLLALGIEAGDARLAPHGLKKTTRLGPEQPGRGRLVEAVLRVPVHRFLTRDAHRPGPAGAVRPERPRHGARRGRRRGKKGSSGSRPPTRTASRRPSRCAWSCGGGWDCPRRSGSHWSKSFRASRMPTAAGARSPRRKMMPTPPGRRSTPWPSRGRNRATRPCARRIRSSRRHSAQTGRGQWPHGRSCGMASRPGISRRLPTPVVPGP